MKAAGDMVETRNAECLLLSALQQAAGKRRDDGHGDHQRQHDGNRDGYSDVAEQLARFQFHDQDRNEHKNSGQGRNEDRSPDLLGPVICCLSPRLSGFSQAEDILEYNNCGIDDHTHGKGDPGQ